MRAKMWHEPYSYGPCGLWRGWMCLLRGHKPWFTVKYQTAGNKIMDNTVCFLKVAVNLETQGKYIFHTDIQSILVYDVCCFPITLCDDWLAGDGRKHLLSHGRAPKVNKSSPIPIWPDDRSIPQKQEVWGEKHLIMLVTIHLRKVQN